MSNSFLGPSSAWDEEDDSFIFDHAIEDAKESLRRRLLFRASQMESKEFSFDQLVLEIKKQIAECVVEGNLGTSTELTALVWDLLELKEHHRSGIP